MLFILTGVMQTGKTRWLEHLIEQVHESDMPVYGVVAPGQWIDHRANAPAGQRFEKLGIDNILLPQNERIAFARRPDLVERYCEGDDASNGSKGEQARCSQSSQAKLGWAIDDAAIDQVNAHFCTLCAQAKDCTLPEDIKQAAGITVQAPKHPGLLVIDELGPLELLKNGGLTSAMDVLSRGPSPLCAHALIVVRESLCDTAAQRFGDCWGGATAVYPNDAACDQVLSCLFGSKERFCGEKNLSPVSRSRL